MSEATSTYVPYLNIWSLDDLRLLSTRIETLPDTIDIPPAHYPGEVTLWLEIEASPEDLFSEDGELLCLAEAADGARGWQLSLTPHGYLRFECIGTPDALKVESRIPLASFRREGAPCRLGVSISNAGHFLRGSGYEKEDASLNRIRLLVDSRCDGEVTVCGWAGEFNLPDLAAVPRRLRFHDPQQTAFRGRISGVTLHNTGYFEFFARQDRPSAAHVVPPVPGGGGFNAHWIAEDAIEVFSHPQFSGTGSAWCYLEVADESDRLRALCMHTLWSGRATMNPSWFISLDGDRWERLAPSKIEMRGDSPFFTVWLPLTVDQARGCYVSSAIPFLESHRAAFLEWTQSQLGAQVTSPGCSVEGRDIPIARIGPDDPDRFHVVLICGQHSLAEAMTAHLLRPMLEESVRLKILERCTFHLFPTVNVDCAHYGGNGLNANRRNTNRHWVRDVQPENQAVIAYLETLRQKGIRVGLAMDLHAGGVWRNHVLYGLAHLPQPLSEAFLCRQDAWLGLLAQHAGLRRREQGRLPHGYKYAMDRFVERFDAPAFLLELSLCSYFDPETRTTRPFSQDSLDVVGRGLARAIASGA